MARLEGLEPPTLGFGIRCSTNCLSFEVPAKTDEGGSHGSKQSRLAHITDSSSSSEMVYVLST